MLENRVMAVDDDYGVIVKEYQQQIFAYIYRMVKNREDAEDLTQETFIKAYRKLSELNEPSAMKSWFYQIAYRTTMNHFRSKKLMGVFSNFESINEISYEEDYSLGEYSEKVTEIFSSLTYKEHTLLTLRAIEEMSYFEIGEIMNTSPATLRKRYERLIARLKKRFPEKEV